MLKGIRIGLRSAAVALGLSLGVTVCGATGVSADGLPFPVAVVASFNSAWNGGEIDQVMAHFGADAVVEQHDVWVYEVAERAEVEEMYGTGASVEAGTLRRRGDTVIWAGGFVDVRRWIAALLALDHRVEATGYTLAQRAHGVEGETVTWRYRASARPYRSLPGVSPAEGTAEAVVRGARIVRLTLRADDASVERRREDVQAAFELARLRRPRDFSPEPPRQPTPRQDVQGSGLPSPVRGLIPAAIALGLTALVAAVSRPAGERLG